MTDAQKRQYVADLYPGPKWKKRVARMPDSQVLAIYLDHVDSGEKPEHDETDSHEEPLLDIPVQSLQAPGGPHANEDQFEMY